jgi:predicted AAA+ superfamily ATPase
MHAKIVGMDRLLEKYIKKDLEEKIVLLSGPRQSGKTTLSKVISNDFEYFNYDLAEDRLFLNEKSWRKNCDLVIFDELHKMKNWKSWVKGIYDTWGTSPKYWLPEALNWIFIEKWVIPWPGGFSSSGFIPLILKN